MVKVFKTNIEQTEQVERLIALMLKQFPCDKINVDLADCDKILRAENRNGHVESYGLMEWVKTLQLCN